MAETHRTIQQRSVIFQFLKLNTTALSIRVRCVSICNILEFTENVPEILGISWNFIFTRKGGNYAAYSLVFSMFYITCKKNLNVLTILTNMAIYVTIICIVMHGVVIGKSFSNDINFIIYAVLFIM